MEDILMLLIPCVLGFFVLKFLFSQLGCLLKLLIHSASGFLCLWLLNMVSGVTGIVFEINIITVLLVGFLGIPGIVLLVLKHFFM